MRVLFLGKKRNTSYGISFGLRNSAEFVANALMKYGVAEEAVAMMVVDGNSIDKEVYNFEPDVVVIEAIWVTPEKIEELCLRYPKVKWTIRIHSKTPFLANEGMAFKWINGYK